MKRAFVLAFLLLASACAPTALLGPGPRVAPVAHAPVWPDPPQDPRIRFLYAFRGPDDLGFRRPFFDRMWAWLVGAEVREMVRPYAIAVDDGLMVVADPGLRAVHFFYEREQSYRRIAKIGDEPLLSPVGVAIGPQGIAVADSALGKLFILTRTGERRRVVEGLLRPTGVAVDRASGRIYVAETRAHRIAVLDRDGARLFTFGKRGTEPGAFNFPTHLALANGRLYVNDTMNFRVQIFDLDGKYLGAFGEPGDGSGYFAQAKGIGIDSEGHVYVVDTLFDRVQIFDPDTGQLLLAFGGQGSDVGEMWLPSGLAIADDRIYVADSYNRRIQVFAFLGGS